jgi:hypothetical protein
MCHAECVSLALVGLGYLHPPMARVLPHVSFGIFRGLVLYMDRVLRTTRSSRAVY